MRGNLIYLIGPSGVGKDSLIAYARGRLDGTSRLLFAHRYITRPVTAGHENYVALSDGEFELRRGYGLFLLDWAAHGYSYGIGSEVEQWLERGLSVLVNGSRTICRWRVSGSRAWSYAMLTRPGQCCGGACWSAGAKPPRRSMRVWSGCRIRRCRPDAMSSTMAVHSTAPAVSSLTCCARLRDLLVLILVKGVEPLKIRTETARLSEAGRSGQDDCWMEGPRWRNT